MPAAPSFDDLLNQGMVEALARRGDLLFAEGDVSVAQLHAGAAMADAVVRYAAQSFGASFIDLAKGDDLTTLVDDHLNLQRQAATSATTVLRFLRSNTSGAGTIPAGTIVAGPIGADGSEIRFITTAPASVLNGAAGPYDIPAAAMVAGRDGNVAADSLTRLITTVFDATFTVTNPDQAAGGNAEESDDQLRVRARAFWQTLRRGTLAALEFGALTVPAVRVAAAREDATGLVLVVVTDEDGNSNAQMVLDVGVALQSWRSAGVAVTVMGGQVLEVDVGLFLTLAPGVSVDALASIVDDAVTARARKLRMGDTLYLDQIKHATIDVDPDGIEAASVTYPLADVVPTAFQVIRVSSVTVTDEESPPPPGS